jgi:HEXXH motif-containing protein
VTPLDAGDGHEDRGSSARHAFGAIAVSRSSPENLAVTLVHELAHLLLGAALDVLALYQPGRPERIAVNWRSDPRPIEGVLQGAYAHKAVADVWRGRRDRRPADAHATAEHRKYRAWTQSAMVELRSSGALTAAGLRLLASMEIDMGEWRP